MKWWRGGTKKKAIIWIKDDWYFIAVAIVILVTELICLDSGINKSLLVLLFHYIFTFLSNDHCFSVCYY